eukprot:1408825-Rhodomonas_salina.2
MSEGVRWWIAPLHSKLKGGPMTGSLRGHSLEIMSPPIAPREIAAKNSSCRGSPVLHSISLAESGRKSMDASSSLYAARSCDRLPSFWHMHWGMHPRASKTICSYEVIEDDRASSMQVPIFSRCSRVHGPSTSDMEEAHPKHEDRSSNQNTFGACVAVRTPRVVPPQSECTDMSRSKVITSVQESSGGSMNRRSGVDPWGAGAIVLNQ